MLSGTILVDIFTIIYFVTTLREFISRMGQINPIRSAISKKKWLLCLVD